MRPLLGFYNPSPGLFWISVVSNLLIAGAYFCITAALVAFLVRWRSLPYKPAVGLVAAFILACGAGRLLIAISLWAPLYWLSGAVDAVTAFLFVVAAIVSVGAAAYPFADRDPMAAEDVAAELVKRSNFALADAKRGGSGSFRQYAKELDDRERNSAELRRSMQRGLEEHQFILHYHPIVDLASGEIVGAEALLRWAHPERGMQRPDVFIPEAESSGLIVPLGAWVIRTAFFEVQEWQKRCSRPARIAINVSGVQLLDPNFVSVLDGVIKETGVDPRLIDLELTESAFIDAPALSVLQALRARGCQLVVDDFGTGYSSFRYLQTLPISAVKIDQTFVRHMVIDSSDASIVRAIVAVAKSLGLSVIAEGIETPAQRDLLGNEGCYVGQGYLFSLPLTSEDFCWLLTSNAKLPLGEEHEPLPAGEKGEADAHLNLPKAGKQLAEEMK